MVNAAFTNKDKYFLSLEACALIKFTTNSPPHLILYRIATTSALLIADNVCCANLHALLGAASYLSRRVRPWRNW